MAEPEIKLPHKLTLDEQARLNLTGAKEVLHFDEDLVELRTSRGILVIQGRELRLKCLALEDGSVMIQGQINALIYNEPRRGRGLFR